MDSDAFCLSENFGNLVHPDNLHGVPVFPVQKGPCPSGVLNTKSQRTSQMVILKLVVLLLK